MMHSEFVQQRQGTSLLYRLLFIVAACTPFWSDNNTSLVYAIESSMAIISQDLLICRIVLEDTLYQRRADDQDDSDTFAAEKTEHIRWLATYSVEEISCIHVLPDGSEDGFYTLVQFPPELKQEQAAALRTGQLFVSVTEATIDKPAGTILTQPTSTFTVIDRHDQAALLRNNPRRQLQKKAYNDAKGTRTYAIVRISTSDSSLPFTAQRLRDRYTNPQAGMQAQYAACSANKLQWVLHDVYDIHLPGTVASYGSNPRALRNEAIEIIKEQTSDGPFPHVDNMLFCIPPGTGGWIANAATSSWVSQYNDAWCLSLTSVMHEVGHNLGLGHSNENGVKYGDWTGFMGSALSSETGPAKCFNAANHHKFAWFDDRTMKVTSNEHGRGIRIEMAAFTDYARTAEHQPVILNFNGQFFGQYNRAKDYNIGTEEHKDKFVIIEQVEGSTELRAALDVGQSTTVRVQGRNWNVQVCNKRFGIPDILEVGVSTDGGNPCSHPLHKSPGAQEFQTVEPTTRPTSKPPPDPTKTPTRIPTQWPTVYPTGIPTAEPIAPTGFPTEAPSVGPTESPTFAPTQLPSASPSVTLRGEDGDEFAELSPKSMVPSNFPSQEPSFLPSSFPTDVAPSETPSAIPSSVPSTGPSPLASQGPSIYPSSVPSLDSAEPSVIPSMIPSIEPSFLFSEEPSTQLLWLDSAEPSEIPSVLDSTDPSVQPSTFPSTSPSDTLVEPPTEHHGGGNIFDKHTGQPTPGIMDESTFSPSTSEPTDAFSTSHQPTDGPIPLLADETTMAPTLGFASSTNDPTDGTTPGPTVSNQNEQSTSPPTSPAQDTDEKSLYSESKEIQPDGTIAQETTEANEEEVYVLRQWEKVALKTTWFEYFR